MRSSNYIQNCLRLYVNSKKPPENSEDAKKWHMVQNAMDLLDKDMQQIIKEIYTNTSGMGVSQLVTISARTHGVKTTWIYRWLRVLQHSITEQADMI